MMLYFGLYWILGLILKLILVKAQNCLTPNKDKGLCIDIKNCASLLTIIKANISEENLQFLRNSQCGFVNGSPKVCCPSETGKKANKEINNDNGYLKNSLLPDIRTCGGSFEHKIYGGSEVSPGELPWMTLIKYDTPGGFVYSCEGVLINKRYVLTAAHCVKGKGVPSNWRISGVRLGEFDTTMNPDCYVIGDEKICVPPVIDIPVEKQIVHEMYSKDDVSQKHDIALLKLEMEAHYTEYVQPICLPVSTKIRSKNYENESLLAAGWGETEEGIYSKKLLRAVVRVQNSSNCTRLYETLGIQLGKEHLCAEGYGNKNCKIGSGGPLLARHIEGSTAKWYLAGMISFGPKPCLLKEFADVYTRVSEYIPWIIQHLETKQVNADMCITPNQTNGECRVLINCSPLWALLQQESISEENIQYLRSSSCGFDYDLPKVCCPLATDVDADPQNGNDVDYSNNALLPSTRTCGTSFRDKILGGNKTVPGELPWMALIEYEKPGGSAFSCGGALISKRYVLTAAHCLKGKDLPANWRISRVRLGEYNTTTDPDCYFIKNETICYPPVVDIPIEEQIVHEMYNPLDRSQKHDIALLRLEREVTFTDYIKPICLPVSKQLRTKSYENESLLVAGWGRTENDTYSDILLKLIVPVPSNSSCTSKYRALGVEFGRGQLCAGGEEYKDSCSGDSGGPLITHHINGAEANWFLAGVVSLGPKPCAMKGWAGIYTRVSEYIPWITLNLRP